MPIITEDSNVSREKINNPKRNVAVIGLFRKKKILMVRTKRLPNHWQPIGGGVKSYDTSPIETIIREVYEEAQIKLSIKDIVFEIETNYDFGEGSVYFYTTEISSDTSPVFDFNELEECQWVSLKEALKFNLFPATQKFIEHMINKNEIE